ncbi:MAG: hypothetical protein ACLSUP_02775 [Blautia massiliensis (ex Durand et al. 2017)]
MKCSECSYCWKSEEDQYPCCQYRKIAEFDLAPCEIEEPEEEPNWEDYM